MSQHGAAFGSGCLASSQVLLVLRHPIQGQPQQQLGERSQRATGAVGIHEHQGPGGAGAAQSVSVHCRLQSTQAWHIEGPLFKQAEKLPVGGRKVGGGKVGPGAREKTILGPLLARFSGVVEQGATANFFQAQNSEQQTGKRMGFGVFARFEVVGEFVAGGDVRRAG